MDNQLCALSLGGIAWNTMVFVDRFPEPVPQTVFAKGSHTTVGSSGAGKALNLRHLGAAVTLWGLLGEDDPGRAASDYLAARGIDLIAAPDPAGTMRHINLMDDVGDRISILAHLGSHEVDVDVDVIRPIAAAADIVSVSIMNYCRPFLPMLGELGISTWVDIPNYDGVNPYYRDFIEAADYLFMSSLVLPDWRSVLEGRIAAGATAAVCTHGSAGASGITSADGWIDVPAVEVDQVIDTNDAGDAFFAGFASTWVTGEGLSASMRNGPKRLPPQSSLQILHLPVGAEPAQDIAPGTIKVGHVVIPVGTV